MPPDRSVIVVGAGVAGLAAASLLSLSGCEISILEARDRIGGRIFTLQDPEQGFPIELGAEFIHGAPPAILDPLGKANAGLTEVAGESWCWFNGELCLCDSSVVDSILDQMDGSGRDESFLSFLEHTFPESQIDPKTREAKRRALAYITGFEAADPALVGVHWLVQSLRAEEQIQGHRAFRARNGYRDLIDVFCERLATAGNAKVHKSAVVDHISFTTNQVRVHAQVAASGKEFAASKVLITLPLAVLRTSSGEGTVQFDPPLPKSKFDAIEKLEMGKVMRIVLRFRERFWESITPNSQPNRSLANMGFLFLENEGFPTCWTAIPEKYPTITAWAPFRAAERLSGKPNSFIVDQALSALAEPLQMHKTDLESRLEAAYFHDWQSDPFSRGAYSYGKVGSDGAQEALSASVEQTVFFAGEATDTTGHNGTVHGAIASGYRAAVEILQALT